MLALHSFTPNTLSLTSRFVYIVFHEIVFYFSLARRGRVHKESAAKGPFIKDVRTKGQGRVSPKADIVREVARI